MRQVADTKLTPVRSSHQPAGQKSDVGKPEEGIGGSGF